MHKDSATAFSQNEANAKKIIAAFKATVQRAAKAAKKKGNAKSGDIVLPPIVKIMIEKLSERHGMPFNVTEMDSVEVKPHPGFPCVYELCDFRKDFFILKSVKNHDSWMQKQLTKSKENDVTSVQCTYKPAVAAMTQGILENALGCLVTSLRLPSEYQAIRRQ